MKEPKIEFPCDYPVKVIGEYSPEFVAEVLAIVRRHDDRVSEDKVKERASSKGKYHAISINLWATGKPQLDRLFADLKTHPGIQLVL